MAISDEDIAKVREASDLVSVFSERVPLKQRGHDFWCCCPFHNEKTPSCKIDPSTQLWHCFGCGEGGDVFKFIMKSDDISFPDAVRQLAQRANIDIVETGRGGGMPNSRKARLREVCEETASFYHMQLMRSKSSEAGQARSYLAGRELGGEIPKEWNLGFAPGRGQLVRHLQSKGFSYEDMVQANVAMANDNGMVRDRFFNRIMFPIQDEHGACIAFGGRVIGKGEPKYLNSQETPIFHKSSVLYGLNRAKDTMVSTGVAIIVEGYTDVIALHTSGVKNVVATLGTALTQKHIRLIGRYAKNKIVYLFDGDEAGQRAADRALEFIDDSMTPEAGSMRTDLYAVTLPDNLDPADFVSQRGKDDLIAHIETAKPLIAYGLERRMGRFDLTSAEGRSQALGEALKVLAPIKDSLLAKDYAVQLAGKLQLREQDVLDELSRIKPPRRFRDDGDADTAGKALAGTQEGYVQGQAPAALRISQSERNRRRVEREVLSLASQYPEVALQHVDALAQTNWHEPIHAELAGIVLEQLSVEGCTPAQIVAAATAKVPRSANILTEAHAEDAVHAEKVVAYLADDLAIGDMEQTVSALKATMASQEDKQGQDYDLLFQSVVELQREIRARKAAHKPII